MTMEARNLERFLRDFGQEALANQAGDLAGKLEAARIRSIVGIETLTVGTMTKADFYRVSQAREFPAGDIHVRTSAKDLIDRIHFTSNPQDLKLVVVDHGDLGLGLGMHSPDYRRVLEAGRQNGFDLVHPEVALYLLLSQRLSPGNARYMAMEPITSSDGSKGILKLIGKRVGEDPWQLRGGRFQKVGVGWHDIRQLESSSVKPNATWMGYPLVFSLPSKQ